MDALRLPLGALCALLLAACASTPPGEGDPPLLPLRERAERHDAWLTRRLDTLVPELMRREGIAMWILVAREDNEDPVLATMLPASWLGGARRRTILVFHDHGGDRGVERLAVARYPVGDAFPSAWDKEHQPDQWERLAELVAERDPDTIALDVSPTFAKADGLSASEREALLSALGPRASRVVSAERLAVGWLETRIPEELELYPEIVAVAHAILAEGLSSRAITPGRTTTQDLQWWFRERVAELRLGTWFHPSVSVQSAGGAARDGSFADERGGDVIRRGDLVHVDFGITYLGLNTDTQQHAYVLHEGETDAPEGLVQAMAVGNRLQELLMAEFVTGRTGNQILAAALAAAEAEGIDATIYTHPLGHHGHGAGPTIGMWDQQGGVPGSGDYPLYPSTAYSIELMAAVPVPEWSETVRIMLEEDALFDGERVRWLDGRQTRLHLVR
jgi:Xaa-Pro aminopeptidase